MPKQITEDQMATLRDEAAVNAGDTCRTEGLRHGTEEYRARFNEIYEITLFTLTDMGGE